MLKKYRSISGDCATFIQTSALAASIAVLLTACGGNAPDPTPPQATLSDIHAGAATPGPTPFISFIPLSGQSLKDVVSYHYTIAAKEGSASRPVDVRYSPAALSSRGYYTAGSAQSTLPVFGLYAGYANQVAVELLFGDGSTQQISTQVSAPPYVDPKAILDRPRILVKRAAGSRSDLNYFAMKSLYGGVVITDSDGTIRWVSPGAGNAMASTYFNGAVYIGTARGSDITRIELDGRTTTSKLASVNFNQFHHNIDVGKTGMLGELDSLPVAIESALAEFDPTGAVSKEWDFAALISRYMTAHGDDPSAFVRPGIDWFHINASAYDRRDDSIIASSRENFVIKFDYSSGDIKWILGDPTKYWYTFPSLRAKALKLDLGGLYPIGQHALSITADGRLMLFNNGFPSLNQPAGAPVGEARTYSAVSAYDIDAVAMTAHEAWRFDYGQTIFSSICSSAYHAPGGSLLINYATADNRTKARIVGLDPARTVMFDFEYPTTNCDTSWNAMPIALDAMTFQ